MSTPRGLDRGELESIIERELSQSQGEAGDDLARTREQSLNYYQNRPRGTEVAGRSAVLSTDLGDMVEAVVAQMMPAFGGDAPAQFEPLAEADEDQAALESAFVNDQIMGRNRGYTLIQEAIKDALLQMNGIVKVWVERREDVIRHRVTALEEDELVLALIPENATDDIELVSQTPTPESDGALWDAELKTTRRQQRLRLRAVAPENWRFQEDWSDVSLAGIRFCAERELQTRSSLVEQGFDVAEVYALAAYTQLTDGQQHARHGDNAGQIGGQEPSTQLVETWDVYLRADTDGDGIAEQHRILYAGTNGTGAGGHILEDVEVSGVPYAAGVAILRPHEFNGISLFEKLKQTIDIKTAALRQWLDNMAAMNNRRIAYRAGAVSLVDLLTSKPGGGVECRDPHGDLNVIPVDDIGPSILQLIHYMDGSRTEQCGASLDFIDAEAQIAGHSGVAIEGQYVRKEALAAMFCRNIAETLIAETYLLVHRTMREAFPEPIQMRTGAGAWIESTPAAWPERTQVRVKAGLSIGERQAKRSALEAVIGQQKEALQAGQAGILTSPEKLYAAIIDWGYAAQVANPEMYWIDPATPEAQQTAAAAAAKQEEAQRQMGALQLQLGQMQVQFEKYKVDAELKFKYFDAVLDAEVDEAKLVAAGHDKAQDARVNLTIAAAGARRAAAGPNNGA